MLTHSATLVECAAPDNPDDGVVAVENVNIGKLFLTVEPSLIVEEFLFLDTSLAFC